MTPRLPFRLEYLHPDGHWFMVTGDQDSSLQYLRGILSERRYRSPRLAARIVRDRDGRVMEELPASTAPELPPGMDDDTARRLRDALMAHAHGGHLSAATYAELGELGLIDSQERLTDLGRAIVNRK